MENAAIAERLEAYAALLDLAGSGYYTVRAYRKAAELIRSTPADVDALVRAGRARELAGIGPGIDARLRELVQTGEIAELRELERQALPELVGVARLLGLSTKRMRDLGHALGIATLAELREASAAGGLEGVPGIGPKTAARIARRAREAVDGRGRARDAPEPGAGARRRDRGGARRRAGRRSAALAATSRRTSPSWCVR